MTIQKRLTRSNIVMLIVPVAIAGILLVVGMGLAALLLQTVYLPRLGLTLQDLHAAGEELDAAGEQLENVFHSMKLLIGLYLAVVIVALLAAVVFTNIYLTRTLFSHIQQPLDILVQGVQRIRDGDLETPIAYTENDEFKAACDAVDEMAARLHASLAEQQRQQQKKQEMLAGMSHDLKSPLTTIRAYTEALLEDITPDAATRHRYLQTIYARETELEALVNRLFELAKLGASSYPVHLQPLSLREAVCACTEGYTDLTVQTAEMTDCTVQADRELLSRIIGNLLDNSKKYGADTVILTSEIRGKHAALSFTDNGPGVPDDQLSKLFDVFYRGDAARKNPGGGSGLGLAVVREAAERMHGQVRAARGDTGGLCIVLTLPLTEVQHG